MLSTWCSFCCLQLLRSTDESLQFLKSTRVSPAVPITILLTHWPYLFAFCLCAFTAASTGWLMGAHVSAYTDGTVHVSTGVVEIGQGLNTMVALVVAMTLGLPVAHVWAEGGDTRMCSNSACTGGSGTSESCCNAAMQAALELKSRVQDKLDRGMAKNEGQSLQAEGWFDGCVYCRWSGSHRKTAADKQLLLWSFMSFMPGPVSPYLRRCLCRMLLSLVSSPLLSSPLLSSLLMCCPVHDGTPTESIY